MKAFDIPAELSSYVAVPYGVRRSQAILDTARDRWGLALDDDSEETRLGLRRVFDALETVAPDAALAVFANLAEAAVVAQRPDLAIATTLALLPHLPETSASSREVGQRLGVWTKRRRASRSAVRDLCRLLLAYVGASALPQAASAYLAFRNETTTLEFDELAALIGPARTVELAEFHWEAIVEKGDAEAVLDRIAADGESDRRSGVGWWESSDALERTAIVLVACRRHPAVADDLSRYVVIPASEARGSIAAHLAAALTWEIIGNPGPSNRSPFRHPLLGLDEKLIDEVRGSLRANVSESLGPVRIVLAALWTEALFMQSKEDFHAAANRLYCAGSRLVAFENLETLFATCPGFAGRWYSSWFQHADWLRYESIKIGADDRSLIDEPIERVLETSSPFALRIDRLIEIVLDRLTVDPSEQFFLAAIRVVEQLASRNRHPARVRYPQDPDIRGARQIVEALIGVSTVENVDLSETLTRLADVPSPRAAALPALLPAAIRTNLAEMRDERASILLRWTLRWLRTTDHWGGPFFGILRGLELAGYGERIAAEVRELAANAVWVFDPQAGPIEVRSDLAATCIRVLAARDRSAAEVLIDALVMLWRRLDESPDAAARRYDQEMLAEARHTLPRALLGFSLKDATHAEELRKRALLVEVEFAQRMIAVEHRRWQSDPIDDGPFPVDDVARVLDLDDHARQYRRRDSRIDFVDVQPSTPTARKFANGTRPSTIHTANRIGPERTGVRFEAGSVERTLIDVVAPSTALLKIGFTLEGKLAWTLFRTDGNGLSVAASGAREDLPGLDEALRGIVARFDRRCAALLALRSFRRIEALAGTFKAMNEVLAEGARADAVGVYADLTADLESFPHVVAELSRTFGTPDDWRMRRSELPSAAIWEAVWSEETVASDFDAALEELLEATEAVLPVKEIGAALAKDDDVVLMLDDVLHSLPIAFLRRRVDGIDRHLFELARSFRVVIAPLVQATLAPWERNSGKRGRDQILCLSGLSGTHVDEAVATRELFERHAGLATKHNLVWRGAWSNPPGDHDVMARGLNAAADRGVRTALLTILAHGDRDGGVAFESRGPHAPQEIWTGRFVVRHTMDRSGSRFVDVRRGCELFSADLLLQVSCSLGRLSRQSFTDSRGYVVNLMIAGARATVAARWPVLAADAVRFGNEIAENYLSARQAAHDRGTTLSQAQVRARAVAETRRAWIAERRRAGGTRPPVGAHTAAAFELFGFG